jgi:site-specific DNA-methyltransferase (adenine-specific)
MLKPIEALSQKYHIIHADCREWLKNQPTNSFHAVITDPPYGLREYSQSELKKMKKGKGGIWRIPPKIGGSERNPLPRFTVLTPEEITVLRNFFFQWGNLVKRPLVPGGHIFIASNPLLVHVVSSALTDAGLEVRGMLVRQVRTLKGGFRPKLAEKEFEDVSSMPRSGWEPWAIFRKPFSGRLSENLKRWGTGGLRRNPDGTPLCDVIPSERTPSAERTIAPHPSLKPQRFLRRLVWASLPLGKGIIVDTFCGSGSTIAASTALGYTGIGIETSKEYVEMARRAVPKLSMVEVDIWKNGNENNKQNSKVLRDQLLERF